MQLESELGLWCGWDYDKVEGLNFFSESIQFLFFGIVFGCKLSNYLKVCLKSKYTTFCQNNMQKKNKNVFSAQIDSKDTQEHMLIALIVLLS